MGLKTDKDTFKARVKAIPDENIIEPDFDNDISYECFYNGTDFEVVVNSLNIDGEKLAKLKDKYEHIKSEKI